VDSPSIRGNPETGVMKKEAEWSFENLICADQICDAICQSYGAATALPAYRVSAYAARARQFTLA
jgi:hypothetical protein